MIQNQVTMATEISLCLALKSIGMLNPDQNKTKNGITQFHTIFAKAAPVSDVKKDVEHILLKHGFQRVPDTDDGRHIVTKKANVNG